jgi:DNA-binding GntR family transcriptional regulator
LKAEGVGVAEVHKGFRVFKMDEKELSEFCEFRLALESQALRSAYNNKRLELVRELKYLIKDFTESIKNKDIANKLSLPPVKHKVVFE